MTPSATAETVSEVRVFCRRTLRTARRGTTTHCDNCSSSGGESKHQTKRRTMRILTLLLLVAGLAFVGCQKSEDQTTPPATNAPPK